ncbi:MAG: hypothetical protein IPH35_24175 [Rhodoferax sp.]|nr:hypothetical protein [Rhodoferax sp.]
MKPTTTIGSTKRIADFKLNLKYVSLRQILGLDKEIGEFFEANDFNFETVIDFEAWSNDAAQWVYMCAPMLLVRRDQGFDVIGTGRTWRVAQQLFADDDAVPTLQFDSHRLSKQVKLQIVAAELFGLCSEFRTRPHVAARLMQLWQAMNDLQIPSITGSGAKAFARGTGYSLKPLQKSKKPNAVNSSTENPDAT